MSHRERRAYGKRLRARLAELVIARHWPIKTAAHEIGIGLSAAENHVATLRRMIRFGTDRLMKTSV